MKQTVVLNSPPSSNPVLTEGGPLQQLFTVNIYALLCTVWTTQTDACVSSGHCCPMQAQRVRTQPQKGGHERAGRLEGGPREERSSSRLSRPWLLSPSTDEPRLRSQATQNIVTPCLTSSAAHTSTATGAATWGGIVDKLTGWYSTRFCKSQNATTSTAQYSEQ